MNESISSSIKVQKTENSRLGQLDFDNIQFGKIYCDHMLVAKCNKGVWGEVEIKPYENLSLSPATAFIHYGQAIFEGIKAYKSPEGEPIIFRPDANWQRFNRSARRMAMPEVPEKIFLDGLKKLVALDKAWIPSSEGTSLYLRPFMFSSDEFIGVKTSDEYTFMIITSPAGPYYSKPVSIYVQDEYVRAFPGGIGFTKAAGNYGMSMYPTQQIKDMGYDQILWTDGFEHKYVQEIGTMNVFFQIGDTVITPDLEGGTILAGITRDSVITLLKERGSKIEERPITIMELEEAYRAGTLREAFGSGTAASLAPISDLTMHGEKMMLPDVSTWETLPWLRKTLADIRYGRSEDEHGWVTSL